MIYFQVRYYNYVSNYIKAINNTTIIIQIFSHEQLILFYILGIYLHDLHNKPFKNVNLLDAMAFTLDFRYNTTDLDFPETCPFESINSACKFTLSEHNNTSPITVKISIDICQSTKDIDWVVRDYYVGIIDLSTSAFFMII